MTEHPHDIADLYLAPVVLAVDARIDELAALSDEKLALHIAIASDRPDWTDDMRRDAVLRAACHLIDLHGWELSWDDRGIRLAHGKHSLVLGIPPNVGRYLAHN